MQKCSYGPGRGQIVNSKLGMKQSARLSPDLAAWDPIDRYLGTGRALIGPSVTSRVWTISGLENIFVMQE